MLDMVHALSSHCGPPLAVLQTLRVRRQVNSNGLSACSQESSDPRQSHSASQVQQADAV